MGTQSGTHTRKLVKNSGIGCRVGRRSQALVVVTGAAAAGEANEDAGRDGETGGGT